MLKPMRALAFALLCSSSVAAAAPLTLADALSRAENRGADGRAARAQLPVARAEVTTARMFPNPGLLLSAGRSEPVFSASVELRLPILGQLGARARAAEAGVREVEAETQSSLWRIRRETRVAYYAAVRAEDEARIAEKLEALTRRVAEIAAERFDVGSGARLEREQAHLIYARAKQDVLDRQAALRVARIELARVLGGETIDDASLIDRLDQVGATPALAELLDDARRAHPELRAIVREREAALARVDVAHADRRPTFLVELGVEVLDPATCNPSATTDVGPRCAGPRGGLGFDLPLFNWNRGPIERARAEASAAAVKLDAASVRVDARVRTAFAEWSAADARAKFFDRDYVPAATAVEEMAREGFSAGRTGLLPLIEAERAVLEAELGRVGARFEVQAARAELEEASGVALSTP